MPARYRTPYVLGFLLVLGGLLLLAFTQVRTVLPDPNRTELSQLEGGEVISEMAAVLFSALLVTLGIVLVLGHASPAPLFPRTLALLALGLALPIFLVVQNLLVINGVSLSVGDTTERSFSASYFFHSGGDLSFAAVYLLFFFTLTLVFVLLGAVGYLLAPGRFQRALFDRLSWPKNEAIHIAATLLLLLSLSVLFFYFLRLVAETDNAALRGRGLFAETLLVPLYYLLCLLLVALALVVAAHAFLLDWGTSTPLDFPRLVENIRTIARVERGLALAAGAINVLILLGPTLPSDLVLSHTFAFGVSPRGLSYAFFLLLLPYLPYAFTQRRLDVLLRAGRAPATSALFAERSLRLVLTAASGLVLLTVAGVAAGWDPLALAMAYSAWTAGVLLAHAVRIETGRGLPRVAFRGEAGPPLYFAFLGLALTTGLMLWGSGNTFEVALQRGDVLVFTNESSYGQDVLGRVGAAVVIAGSLLLSLDLWLRSYRIERRFLAHYLGIFLATTIAALLVFTVGVWTAGGGAIEDAYAGYAFHQYYATEKIGAALLLSGAILYVFWGVGRILRPLLEESRKPTVAKAENVRWK